MLFQNANRNENKYKELYLTDTYLDDEESSPPNRADLLNQENQHSAGDSTTASSPSQPVEPEQNVIVYNGLQLIQEGPQLALNAQFENGQEISQYASVCINGNIYHAMQPIDIQTNN